MRRKLLLVLAVFAVLIAGFFVWREIRHAAIARRAADLQGELDELTEALGDADLAADDESKMRELGAAVVAVAALQQIRRAWLDRTGPAT